MDPRFARIDALFQGARRLPPAERRAFLEREAADDAALRAEVEDLLAALDSSPDIEPTPVIAGLARILGETPTPDRFGEFRIVRRIASGGMGVVYEAEQRNPSRRVALKVLHAAAATPEGHRRFEREAEILARLHHRFIAQIHVYGTTTTPTGECPFLAMELVDGVPLTAHARGLDLRGRLELLANVCDAVAHAHMKGVIHRDLKPSNILVTPAGEPRVLDFGVARLLDADPAQRTRTGQVIGTLAYMSPEQAMGDLDRVDARTDVYALGGLGYEMLCGRLPHEIGSSALPDAIRKIVEEDPPDPGTIDRELRGDVSRILAKALAKEPDRRYDGAGAMAEDLRRYLRDEPILARPPTATYQLRKFVRRHRALVGGVAATVTALLIGLVLAVRAAHEEERQRQRADRSAAEARWAASRALLEAASSDLRASAGQAARIRLERIPPEHRGWAWRYLSAEADTSARFVPVDAERPSAMVIGGGSGGLIDARGVATFDLNTGVRTEPALRGIRWQCLCRLGESIVAIGNDKKNVTWARLDTGAGGSATLGANVSSAAGTEDGSRIAIAMAGGLQRSTITVFDTRSGKPVAHALGDPVAMPGLAFSPDGKLLAAAGALLAIHILDAATGREEHALHGHTGGATALAFSPDGRFLLSGADDKTLALWRPEDGALLNRWRGHDGEVVAVAWSPDGARVASGDSLGTIRVWNVASGACERVLQGHDCRVGSLVFRDARTLVSVGTDGVRWWDVPAGQDPNVFRYHGGLAEGNPFPYIYAVVFSPDGSLLASGGWDKTVRLVDPATGDLLATLKAGSSSVFDVAFRADGRRLVAGGDRRMLWDADTGQLLADRKPGGKDASYAASPDGRFLAVTDHNVVRLLDTETLEARAHWADYFRIGANDCAWSPDGRLIATVGDDGMCVVRTAPEGRLVRKIETRHGQAFAVAFDGAGGRIATGGGDHVVRVWDTQSGRMISELRGHVGIVYALAFHPDGTLLASGARDNTIRIWSLKRDIERLELRGHENYVHGLAFSPDGETLASASGDNTVRLWTTLPMRERLARAEAERAARARMAPAVDALFEKLVDARAVADAIRGDRSLAEADRRAALHLVLLRAGGKR
ncbi:MAG TPA: protein kinase [Planctomycetota bacterium]|nr:protein kinase [Planctomycetota bacterium]